MDEAQGAPQPSEAGEQQSESEQHDGFEPEGTPAEVERDLSAELAKLDLAASFDPSAAGGFAPTQPADPLAFDPSYGLSSSLQAADPGRRQPGAEAPLYAFRTLDDLCAAFPKLETGEQWLHVERKSPAHYRGRPCRGWIENLYRPIDMNEFAKRYGGGGYTVRVVGPQLSSVGHDGRHTMRTLATLELAIAGEPRFPATEVDGMQRMGPFEQALHPEVEVKRLELTAKDQVRQQDRADRLQEQLMEARKPPDYNQMFEAMERASQRRVEEARTATAESMGALRAHAERLARQLTEREQEISRLREDKDAEIHKLRDDVYRVRQEASEAARTQETTRITECKDQHERELKRVERDHSEKLERLASDHRTALSDMSARSDRDRKDAADQADRERSALRLDAERRERQLIDDHSRQMESMRIQYESRLEEAHRAAEREIRSCKDSLGQQLAAVQSTESSKTHMAQSTAEIQVRLLESQLAKAETGLAAASRELEEARRRAFKEPLQAIADAHQLVELTTQGKEEGELDWKRGLVQVARNFIDKLPETAKQVAEVREQNKGLQQQRAQQLQQQQAAYAAAAQAAAAQPARLAQMAQPQPQRGRRAFRQPPPGHYQVPGEAPLGPRPPDASPPMSAAPLGASGVPIVRAAAPISALSEPAWPQAFSPVQPEPAIVPAEAALPVEPPPQPPSPEVPVAEPVSLAPQPEPPAVEIDAARVIEFATELEEAIKGGLIGPKKFAASVVERLGVDAARTIVTTMSAEEFAEGVEKGGGGASVIVTRDGRKYLRELWDAAAEIVGAAAKHS